MTPLCYSLLPFFRICGRICPFSDIFFLTFKFIARLRNHRNLILSSYYPQGLEYGIIASVVILLLQLSKLDMDSIGQLRVADDEVEMLVDPKAGRQLFLLPPLFSHHFPAFVCSLLPCSLKFICYMFSTTFPVNFTRLPNSV